MLEEDEELHMTTKPARKGNPHVGSDCDDFLVKEGIHNETEAIAVKRVLAFELEVGMQKAQLTKTAMAKRMGTTRAQLDRLRNPDNPPTTLQTLVKAAGAVGKRVKISFVNASRTGVIGSQARRSCKPTQRQSCTCFASLCISGTASDCRRTDNITRTTT
jgi:antitoxin HicB